MFDFYVQGERRTETALNILYRPKRIVSLQPSATVTLRALGLLDRVVACTKYCRELCPEIDGSGRIIVHDSWTAQADQIVAAKPDLVIASVPYQEKSIAEILKAGIPFLGLAPRTLDDIYRDTSMIAGIVGAPERAEHVIREMQQAIAEVAEQAAHIPVHPRVFCEEWGKPLIASQAWVAELVRAAGGQFIGEPGKQITSDDVRSCNPEVVVAAWCGAGDRVPLEKIMRERQWTDTNAGRASRVYCIRDEFLNTPAPTLISGLKALAHALHPEAFPCIAGMRRITSV